MRFFNRKIERHSSIEEDAKRLISNETPFAVTEAFRSIHTNLLYIPTKSKCKKFALTSAFSGEGKTYTAINLAYTIAINSPDLKVLLIDCDMRKPRIAEIVGIKSSSRVHGLSEYLADIDEQPNICNSTLYKNLFLLPSGAESYNAMGLLTSKKMKGLIDLCEEKFDFVIFDTPPVNIVSDTILLNDYIDGYIIATRAEYSDVNSISEAIDRLKSVDANILGFVLSSYNVKNVAGYARYTKYSKYSKYGKYGKYGNKYAQYGNHEH